MRLKIVLWSVSVILTNVTLDGRSELHSSRIDWFGKRFCPLVMNLATGVEELKRLLAHRTTSIIVLPMIVMQSTTQGAGLHDDSATMQTPLISSAPPSPSHSRRRMSVNNIRSVYDRVQRYLTGILSNLLYGSEFLRS